jgi:hypothetical protein
MSDMFPTDQMKKQLAWMNARYAPFRCTVSILRADHGKPSSLHDGSLTLARDGHLNRRPLYANTKEEIDTTFHAGGAGCFARPTHYCQVIAMLLNDGTHPGTGAQILKKETVDTMFTNQIPDMPNFGRQVRFAPLSRERSLDMFTIHRKSYFQYNPKLTGLFRQSTPRNQSTATLFQSSTQNRTTFHRAGA